MSRVAGKCRNLQSMKESELSVKQEQFIAALIAGNSIVVAAKVAGISERTAHNWMKLPHIQEAYKEAKSSVFDEALEGLRDHTKGAIDTIKSIMDSAEVDPAVRLRASHIILTQGIQVHKIEQLAEEIAELKEALGASRV
jgi:phage terminase small subunit